MAVHLFCKLIRETELLPSAHTHTQKGNFDNFVVLLRTLICCPSTYEGDYFDPLLCVSVHNPRLFKLGFNFKTTSLAGHCGDATKKFPEIFLKKFSTKMAQLARVLAAAAGAAAFQPGAWALFSNCLGILL